MSSSRVVTVILAAAPPQDETPADPVERDRDALVSRLAVAAIASRSAEVAVVTGALRAQTEADVAGSGVTCLHNACYREGSSSSLRIAACWALRQRCDAILVFGLDQPLVSGTHIDRLIDGFELHRGRVASYFGGVPDVPAVFPRSDLGALMSLRGSEGARSILGGEDVWLVPFAGGRRAPEPEAPAAWLREAELREAELRDAKLDDLRGRSQRPSGFQTIDGSVLRADGTAAWPLRLRRA